MILISNPNATKPEEWNGEMNGEWELLWWIIQNIKERATKTIGQSQIKEIGINLKLIIKNLIFMINHIELAAARG